MLWTKIYIYKGDAPFSSSSPVYVVPPCCINLKTFKQRVWCSMYLLYIYSHSSSATTTLEFHIEIMSATLFHVYIKIHIATQIQCVRTCIDVLYTWLIHILEIQLIRCLFTHFVILLDITFHFFLNTF